MEWDFHSDGQLTELWSFQTKPACNYTKRNNSGAMISSGYSGNQNREAGGSTSESGCELVYVSFGVCVSGCKFIIIIKSPYTVA